MIMTYTEKGAVQNFVFQELQNLGWKSVKPEHIKLRLKENFGGQKRIAKIFQTVDEKLHFSYLEFSQEVRIKVD